MKNTLKYPMLAAALAVASSAQAYPNGDLLVGFTGGSSDFIYALGGVSALTPGQTWNIGTSLGMQFGVVGALNTGSHIYATSPDTSESGYAYDTAFFNQAKANIGTIAGSLTVGLSRTTTPADATGWTMQTDQAAGTPGNYLFNNLFNPNVSIASTASFFDNNAAGATPDGFFSYDATRGVLTYGVVPEPASIGILAGLGLFAVVMRRRSFNV
jgi:hypothetical protein